MKKEEPQRITTLVLQRTGASSGDGSVDAVALEVAEGSPPPYQPPVPTTRVSSFALMGATSGSHLQSDAVALEMAYRSLSANINCFHVSMTVASGEIVPRDMAPYLRVSSLPLMACISSKGHCKADVVALEIATRKDIYSNQPNVEYIY